jgi:hypothetical protein
MKTMFVSAVAVLMFAACAKNAEEAQQGESAAIQADTIFAAEKAATDSVKAVEVKAEVPDAK